MSDTFEQEHYLLPYLQEKLPNLGLDLETYGPYVTGIFPTSSTLDDDDHEHNDTDESLVEIVELLQASSETHSDDDGIWETFKADIKDIQQRHFEHAEKTRTEQADLAREADAKRLQKEIEEAKKSEEDRIRQKMENQSNDETMDAAKRALIEQYSYDYTQDGDGNAIGGGDDDDTAANNGGGVSSSNREHAAHTMREKTAKMKKSNNQVSKKDAREETKKAKEDKKNKKEERRKRAVKGERQR